MVLDFLLVTSLFISVVVSLMLLQDYNKYNKLLQKINSIGNKINILSEKEINLIVEGILTFKSKDNIIDGTDILLALDKINEIFDIAVRLRNSDEFDTSDIILKKLMIYFTKNKKYTDALKIHDVIKNENIGNEAIMECSRLINISDKDCSVYEFMKELHNRGMIDTLSEYKYNDLEMDMDYIKTSYSDNVQENLLLRLFKDKLEFKNKTNINVISEISNLWQLMETTSKTIDIKEYNYSEVCFSVADPSSKYKNQRLARGWDDSEVWNLNITIASFILPRIKKFQFLTDVPPSSVKTLEEWLDILEKIANAFKYYIEIEKEGFSENIEKMESIEEGLQLFKTHFKNLWI